MTVPPRSESPELALRAAGVRVELGGVEVLRGVDLELKKGRVVGVLGPSGAGKTTLFRVLVGELRPSAGSVWLGGRDVSRSPMWRRARIRPSDAQCTLRSQRA